MAEEGYDEFDPLLNQEQNAQYDDDDDDDDAENIQSFGSPIGTGEDEVYQEAESSFGGTGLTATKTQFRNSVVDDFYKQLRYKKFQLYFIKDGERIKLCNAKEGGMI